MSGQSGVPVKIGVRLLNQLHQHFRNLRRFCA